MNTAQKAALTSELESLEALTLGALAGQGPATAGVLGKGEVSTAALDRAAASNAGVGGGDLKVGGGGPVRPGEGGNSLAGMGQTGKTGDSTSGEVSKPKAPVGGASVGGASVSGGTVSNASRVVAGMRAGFRACYQRALADNPDAQGSVRLTIRVGPGGEVQGVSASASGNLPGSVTGCVQGRAQSASFDPPEGGSATIVVPVTFVKQ